MLRCTCIIIKDRTIDFVAPSPEARNNWLQHLNILLVHQRTHDTEKVMTRKDVRHEMHLMSFQIGKLNKQAAKAKSRVRRASMHMGADKKAVARMSMIQSLRSTTGSTMSDKL